ncbi:FGGY family carbohydrate kinase [Desertimonas flava]|uniref:FGGY family carbohydrate kinase n=1 Tax=Desertimonas flava TaxID=2064846 RepID=UPI000E355027|nr:FGGY family carbohydrate kinase [Desertimonas flava]
MTMVLVIDVGTTSLRAALVDDTLRITDIEVRPTPPSTPFPGLVEFDPADMAATALDAATAVLSRATAPVVAVGVANQRSSTIVWDRSTGEPIGPGLGWQDLRTVMECITARSEHGLALAPNQSATKLAWILSNVPEAAGRDLCFGTVDSWLAWTLTGGAAHVTDHTNAAVTGLTVAAATAWNDRVLHALGLPAGVLPEIVPSSGVIGSATALPGAPPLAGLAGDQQSSMVGQGCVRPGSTKITFGTGGMLDTCTGATAPASAHRCEHGTFPIVAWSRDSGLSWGSEAIMLSAGSNVEWLCDDLKLIDSPAASHDAAASVPDAGGVVYVPALLGLGTPSWDYGARGTLLGITRGTTSAHLVRAVLEGVAHRGVDLVEATEADTGTAIDRLRVDGGMSANPTFVQALADLSGRPVEVSPVAEATTMGAAFLAGLAVGVWDDIADAEAMWRPAQVVEPVDGGRPGERDRWADAVTRAQGWIPELSALDF